RDALEVADARQRDGDELLVEVPHARTAQGDLEANGHADAQAEVRDRLLRLRDDRLLAGDLRELTGGRVHRLRVADRLTHPDVDDDLREARDAHHVVVVELLAQLVLDLRVVALLHPAHDRRRWRCACHYAFSSTTIASLHCLQTRSLASSSIRRSSRVCLPQCGQLTTT